MTKDIEQQIAEVSTNFKRGATEMLLLSLLRTREQYAYELTKALKHTSLGLFDIQGPSLYTALYRMEQKGFVATREAQVGRRIRVYYSILPEGEAYLNRLIAEYESITAGIHAVLDKSAARKEDKGGTQHD